jgi:hypothetical protein
MINIAIPCEKNGQNLPNPPPPPEPLHADNQDPSFSWDPFGSQLEFEFAHYHFVEVQSSARCINKALDMWQAAILRYGDSVPWKNAQDLYNTIDMIQHGDAPWKVHKVHYTGPLPAGTPPKWMTETFDLCARDSQVVLHNQLASSEFKGNTNFVPYQQFDRKGRRVWSNLMSADWAWKQAVRFRLLLYKICRKSFLVYRIL